MLLTRRAWTVLGIAAALAAGVAIWRGGDGGDGTGPEEPTSKPPASTAAAPGSGQPTTPSASGAAQTDAPPVPGLGAPPARLEVPRDPPPPEPDTEEEKAFRERLRAIRTGFKFEGGLDLATVLTYLAARHEVKIVVDRSAADACAKAHPSLTMENAPLADALDKLVASAPGLLWDVEGASVRVSRP